MRRGMVERYERLLADALDERTRRTVEALLAREKHALGKQRREIEAWRRRAGEVRATADQFSVPSVQETLRRIADNLNQMADHTEALLTGKNAPGEKVG